VTQRKEISTKPVIVALMEAYLKAFQPGGNTQELWITMCTKWGQLRQTPNPRGLDVFDSLLSRKKTILNQCFTCTPIEIIYLRNFSAK
jgi:hypothetical protein